MKKILLVFLLSILYFTKIDAQTYTVEYGPYTLHHCTYNVYMYTDYICYGQTYQDVQQTTLTYGQTATFYATLPCRNGTLIGVTFKLTTGSYTFSGLTTTDQTFYGNCSGGYPFVTIWNYMGNNHFHFRDDEQLNR